MGQTVSHAWNWLFQIEARCVLIGLDGGGKTTILRRWKTGEVGAQPPEPTFGFNVETVVHANVAWTIWDFSGRWQQRLLWRRYYWSIRGIIYVIDTTDRARLDTTVHGETSARHELHEALEDDQLRDAVLLVLASKQDLPDAMSVDEVTERLGLAQVAAQRVWHVQACSAVTGQGLQEGIDWLAHTLTPMTSAKVHDI